MGGGGVMGGGAWGGGPNRGDPQRGIGGGGHWRAVEAKRQFLPDQLESSLCLDLSVFEKQEGHSKMWVPS